MKLLSAAEKRDVFLQTRFQFSLWMPALGAWPGLHNGFVH
jgi:hypothetical protein